MAITQGLKYELIMDKAIRMGDHELFRIRALADIGEIVKAGDEGGYVECEKNLSQDGAAWIADDAMAYGDAQVMDDALVYSDAVVSGHAVVSGRAQVHDGARVYDHAVVTGNAHAVGGSEVYGRAKVSGDAKVVGGAKVFGDAEVLGDAVLSGDTRVCDNARITGEHKVVTVSNIGDKQATATFFACADGVIRVCFRYAHCAIDDFRKCAPKYYRDGDVKAYAAVADYARCALDVDQ